MKFRHFDSALNSYKDLTNNPTLSNPMVEEINNTLLESLLLSNEKLRHYADPNNIAQSLTVTNIYDWQPPEMLHRHPNDNIPGAEKQVMLFSSGSRAFYGPIEVKEFLDSFMPDPKDRGAYGSLFVGSCTGSKSYDELPSAKARILIVEDDQGDPQNAGENGGYLPNDVAIRLVGDSHGKMTPEFAQMRFQELDEKLQKTILSDGQKDEIIRHVVQHRMALIDSDNPSQIRIAKGTLAPKNLDDLPWNQEKADSSGIDIVIPLSSFKGQKPKVGYYEIDTWVGAKSISQNGKSRTGELNLTEDTLPTLTTRALELVELAKDPRKLAADFIKTYEKQALIRREATVQSDSGENSITVEEIEEAALESMYEMIGQDETITDEMASLLEKETQQEMLIYKALKTAQENNTLEQIVENGYIATKLNDYIRKQKVDIVSGGAIKWNRAIIIPSKDLNDDQICVPGLPMGEDIINFRSPCLLRTDVAIQTNSHTDDILDPKGHPLVGVFAVSDEPYNKYVERRTQEIEAGINSEFGIRNNTYEKKAGQDYDGDTKAAALAKDYPSYVAYLRQMQLPENDYAPVKKEEKLSFGNATIEDVALHIVTDYTGLINNAMKAASNVEHEVAHIQKYASESNKENYIKEVSIHFKLLVGEQLEIMEKMEHGEELKPTDKLYPPEVLEKMTVIADILDTSKNHRGANSVLSTAQYYKHSHDLAKNNLHERPTSQQVEMGLETYRQLLHDDVVQKLAYQNQIAVDAFKSARQPDLEEIDFYKKIPHKKPSHVGRMKDPNIYKPGNEITPNGYDAKQLLLTTLNPIISEASVEIAPNDQFRNLFPNPDNCDNPPYNTDHKVMAINAKKNFDNLFNIAVEASAAQRIEKGPVMECTTKQGNKFTIYNIGQFGIIDIKAGLSNQELNLTFKEDYQNRIMALMPVVNPTTGKTEQKQIGFVRSADAKSLNICGNDGINKTTVSSYFIGPSYTEEQTKALFEEAKQYALSIREWSIQNNCLTEMAAATWDVCTGTNNISQVQKESSRQSNQNFMYQAFEPEYLERLKTFQFTSLKLVGQNQSELDKSEHLDPKTYNFKVGVQASIEEPQRKEPVFLVEINGEYKRAGVISAKDGQIPIGTSGEATIQVGELHTATLSFANPRNLHQIIDIQVGNVSKGDFREAFPDGQTTAITIKQQPQKKYIVHLDGKPVGELTKDSEEHLLQSGALFKGQKFKGILDTIADPNNPNSTITTFSSDAISVQIRGQKQKQNYYNDIDFQNTNATVTIEEKQDKPVMCACVVGADGKEYVLGQFTTNSAKSKETLMELFGRLKSTPETLKKEFDSGHLNGQVIADVTLKGNYSTMKVEINPQTISFPQEWTRRRDIEPPQDDKFNSSAEKLGREITHSMFGREDLTTKVNTTLLKDREPVSVPAYQLTFDYLKHRDVKAFLDKNSIPHLEVNPNNPEINTETARGYRVVRIPCECVENDPKFENVKKALNAKLIDSASANPEISSPYHQKLAETKPITPEFVKLIKSSFPEHDPGKIEELPQTIKKESLSSKRFTPLPTVPAHKGKPNLAEFSRKPEPQPQPQPEPTPIVGTITPPKELAAKLRGGRLNAEGAGVLSTAADAGAKKPVTPTATQTVTPTQNAAVSVTKLSTQKPRLGNSPPASTETAKSTIPPAPTPPPTSLASTPAPAETVKSTSTQNTMATPTSQDSPSLPPAPSHSTPAPPAPPPAPPAPTNTQITANTETVPEPKTTEPPPYQQKPWENMLTSLALNALKKEGQEIIPGVNHASFFQGRLSAFNYTDPATGKDTIKIISNSSNDIIYQKCRGESPLVENLNNSQKQYLSALYQHFSQQLEGSISR